MTDDKLRHETDVISYCAFPRLTRYQDPVASEEGKVNRKKLVDSSLKIPLKVGSQSNLVCDAITQYQNRSNEKPRI